MDGRTATKPTTLKQDAGSNYLKKNFFFFSYKRNAVHKIGMSVLREKLVSSSVIVDFLCCALVYYLIDII